MRKKLLALALTLALVVSLCPATLAANDNYKTWNQGDAPWGTLHIGTSSNSDTMQKSGCFITAVAKLLIHSGQQGTDFTPGKCLSALTECKMLNSSGEMTSNWANGFLQKYAPELTYEPSGAKHSAWSKADAIKTIGDKINDGYYVIVAVKNNGHWVAVDRVDEDDIYIMDNGVNGGVIALHSIYSGITDQVYFKYSGTRHTTTGRSLLDVLRDLVHKDTNASTSQTASLKIQTATAPQAGMEQGKPFYFKGKITSGHNITSATISILSSDGKTSYQSKTITPNKKEVDIATSGLDSLKFGQLSPGSYLFKLTAKDASGSTEVWQQTFSIKGSVASAPATSTPTPQAPSPSTPAPATSAPTSKLAISPTTKPGQNMDQGKPFYFKGKITSDYKVISATISILSSDENTSYQSKTITPNTSSVDIATSGLDSLKFGQLSPGSYLFKLTAKDASGNSKTWQQPFSIKSSTVPSPIPQASTPAPIAPAPATPAPVSQLSISPTTKPGQNMDQGKPFYFKGKITSDYKIISATISILSADGKVSHQSKTISPNTKEVDIATSGLDSLKFGQLAPGSYLFRLTAKDASGNAKTWEQSFSIKGTASTLTISPTTKPGQSMPKGSPFYFKGKITSNYNITSATISILSSDGSSTFQTRTITPNTTSVDIATSGLDSLKFGQLASGSYLFKLTAKDSSGSTKTWQQAFSIR